METKATRLLGSVLTAKGGEERGIMKGRPMENSKWHQENNL